MARQLAVSRWGVGWLCFAQCRHIGAACLRNGDLKMAGPKIERDPLLRRVGIAVIGADELRRQMI
jgi:hypothetical protein